MAAKCISLAEQQLQNLKYLNEAFEEHDDSVIISQNDTTILKPPYWQYEQKRSQVNHSVVLSKSPSKLLADFSRRQPFKKSKNFDHLTQSALWSPPAVEDNNLYMTRLPQIKVASTTRSSNNNSTMLKGSLQNKLNSGTGYLFDSIQIDEQKSIDFKRFMMAQKNKSTRNDKEEIYERKSTIVSPREQQSNLLMSGNNIRVASKMRYENTNSNDNSNFEEIGNILKHKLITSNDQIKLPQDPFITSRKCKNCKHEKYLVSPKYHQSSFSRAENLSMKGSPQTDKNSSIQGSYRQLLEEQHYSVSKSQLGQNVVSTRQSYHMNVVSGQSNQLKRKVMPSPPKNEFIMSPINNRYPESRFNQSKSVLTNNVNRSSLKVNLSEIQEIKEAIEHIDKQDEQPTPLFRNSDFTANIMKQTENFQQNVDDIVKSDSFIKGYKDVEIKRNKNPNQVEMFQQDFSMKMARIENQLKSHLTNIGEQILYSDNQLQEEEQRKKYYHSPIKEKGKSPKRSSVVQNKRFKFNTRGDYKSGSIDQNSGTPLRKVMNPGQQYQQDSTFLTSLALKDRQSSYPMTPIEDESSSMNERFQMFSSSQRSDKPKEYEAQGDLTQIKKTFQTNLQIMHSSMKNNNQANYKTSQIVGKLVDFELNQELKQLHNHQNHEDHKDPTHALDYHKNHMHQTFVKVSNDIRHDLQFAQLAKDIHSPKLVDQLKNDSKFNFAVNCNTEYATILPVLQKIKNKTLNLSNYVMSSGLAKALGKCVRENENFLSRVILDNNSLKDESVGHILEGLAKLHDFKSFILNNNEFGIKSSESIRPAISLRSMPFHLEEIRIVHCKVNPYAISSLLQELNEKSYLKRLALVNSQVGHEMCFSKLIQLLKSSRYLIELDISYNAFKPYQVMELLDTFAENRQLQYLNMSWNNLIEKGDMQSLDRGGIFNEIQTEEKMKELMTSAQAKEIKEKEAKKLGPSAPIEQNNFQILVMSKISRFIKYNQNLLHLDLSFTGLNEKLLRTIGASLKRGKSILSLHVSGNPGVTPALKEYLFNRIKCKKNDCEIFDKQTFEENQTLPTALSFERAISNTLEGHGPMNQFVKDGVDHSQIIKHKKKIVNSLTGRRNSNEHQDLGSANGKLIFQRWIGHKEEMPGSGQWQMLTGLNDHCWVCDKQIYSVIMWTKTIGVSESIDVEYDEKERILEQINIINNESDNESKLPNICGSFTDWHYKSMMTLDDFCKVIDKSDSRHFLKQMKDRGRCRNEVKQVSDFNPNELEKYQNLIFKHQIRQKKYWRQSLAKSLKYNKRPFLVNAHLIQQHKDALQAYKAGNDDSSSQSENDEFPHEQVWVFPSFMKAGKNSYFVKSEGETFVHKTIAPFREEEIHVQCKESKSTTVQRIFVKENSVFKDWKEDNQPMLLKAGELDKKEWKGPRLIKETAEVDRCWDVIEKNILRLKEIFLTLASKSNFPSITLLDFCIFCEICKFMDKNVLLSTIDRLFIATNVEITPTGGENPGKELCRFEFFEILLRIANAKYRETGICQNYSDSLEKLLKENVFGNYKIHPWQEFRDKELWTVDVNDVFEANLNGLKKVFQSYQEVHRPYTSMQDCLDLMIRQTPLQMTEKNAIYCYGMCKMTVVNEADESSLRYKRIQFVEFLEMIGRIADLKYKGTEMETSMSLAQRIEFVIDDVLTIVSGKRKDVKIIIDEHSESDDEY